MSYIAPPLARAIHTPHAHPQTMCTHTLHTHTHTGDVALVVILLYKSYMGTLGNRDTITNTINDTNETISQGQNSFLPNAPQSYEPILPDYLQVPDSYNLKDLVFYLGIGIGSSQLMYHVSCNYCYILYSVVC